MRSTPNLSVERYRIKEGRLSSCRFDGNNGAFRLPAPTRTLFVIVSDGLGWEHVSVSVEDRPEVCPTWGEMCWWVKDLFWSTDECVLQYHPRGSEYRNLHEGCLHLWRPIGVDIPEPNPEMVAPAKAGAR